MVFRGRMHLPKRQWANQRLHTRGLVMKNNLKLAGFIAVLATLISLTLGSSMKASVASDRSFTRGLAMSAAEITIEPAAASESPSPSSDDVLFLKRVRNAGITEAMISDDQAISAAQKVIYLICDKGGPSRPYTQELLQGKFRMNDRQKIDFTQAALQVYRHTSDTNNCGSASHH
jgi:hypothetical protein